MSPDIKASAPFQGQLVLSPSAPPARLTRPAKGSCPPLPPAVWPAVHSSHQPESRPGPLALAAADPTGSEQEEKHKQIIFITGETKMLFVSVPRDSSEVRLTSLNLPIHAIYYINRNKWKFFFKELKTIMEAQKRRVQTSPNKPRPVTSHGKFPLKKFNL